MKRLLIPFVELLFVVAVVQARAVADDVKQEYNETLVDDTEALSCQCDKRFYQHYKFKGCEPVYSKGCDCPQRFNCPETFSLDEKVCHHDGKTYAHKEKVPSSNPCRICSCENSYSAKNALDVTCISVECGYLFNGQRLEEGCYRVHEPDQCCPTGVKCDNSSIPGGFEPDEPTCEVEGHIYHLGQYISHSMDPCLTCVCHANWTGVNDESCRRLDCMMAEKRQNLQQGCLPIYHESTCCPIEFHCDKTGSHVIQYSDDNSTASENQCVFGNNKGNVGDVLMLNRSNDCVECSCKAPPEFTCVHKKCPGPPNDDYDNCRSIYTPGKCCATYECVQAGPTRPPACDPVYCEEGCTEVYVPFGCPICRCNKVLCSPPKCSDDCVIDYDSKPCPSCKCITTFDLSRPMCGPVKCGPQCHEAISPQGCPMCVCGPLCSPPKCGPGCHVQTDVHEGECPGCVCFEDESLSEQVPKILCSPVKCPESCSEAMGDHGCPMCLCGVMCSPPKCDSGCRAEVVPSSGPCPGCVCDKQALQCAPVKCSPGCEEYSPPNGCPLCQCNKLLCSMPKCPQGCEINYDIAPGTCPHCKCPASVPFDRPQCGPVKCGPQCSEGIGPQGCPMCVCGPLCSPPKCEPGCALQTDVSDGQCPGCECTDKNATVQCGTVNCPSFCSQARNEFGCPMCYCEPLCSPPKCDRGCRAEIVPSSGPCPGCICDIEKPLCGPVECGLDCYETISPQGCPMCVCGPQCSPPRCELGCRIQRNVPTGTCPGCDCPSNSPTLAPQIACSIPRCPANCEIKSDPSAGPCPFCDCGDNPSGPMIPPQVACSIPKCPANCEIKSDPSAGLCPFCNCEDDSLSSGPMIPPQVACSIPKCPANCEIKSDLSAGPCPFCNCGDDTLLSGSDPEAFPFCPPVQCDEGCVEEGQMDGCPGCRCNGECVPPKCPVDCEVETNPPSGQCLACRCPIKQPTDMSCPDTPCQLPCRAVKLTPFSCPVCECQAPFGSPLQNAKVFASPPFRG